MKAYASSASMTSAIAARNRWYCRHCRPGAVPSPWRTYPAEKIDVPAEVRPTTARKKADRLSNRR